MPPVKSEAGKSEKGIALKNICGKEREGLLEKVELLDRSSQKLYFEGKLHVGKNAKETWMLTNFFCGKIKEYVKAEEKVVFPLIENRVPQYGLMLIYFHAEHETLLIELTRLRRLLRSLMKNVRGTKRFETMRRIHQRGMYVSHLLQHHLKSEGDHLSKAIHEELTPQEREKVTLRLRAL